MTAPSESNSKPPLPSPPFISVPNIFNFRTIGSHQVPNKDGATEPIRRVRSDFIYRAAEPSRITDEGTAVVRRLGITTFYDLRAASEIAKHAAHMPITVPEGTERVFVPVYQDQDSSPAEVARRAMDYGHEGTDGFVRVYGEILRVGKDAYRKVFEHVRDRSSEPFVVHCTAGKDRTGVFVALLLGLVGVEDDVIADEYSLTEEGLREWIPVIVNNLLKEPEMKGDEAMVRRMVGARKENMVEVLKMIRERWGGAEGYLRDGLGFSNKDIVMIRENIVEDVL